MLKKLIEVDKGGYGNKKDMFESLQTLVTWKEPITLEVFKDFWMEGSHN